MPLALAVLFSFAGPAWAQEEESPAPTPAARERAKSARVREPADPEQEAAKPARVREPADPEQEAAKPARAREPASPPAAAEESDEAAAGAPAVGRKATARRGRRRVAPVRPALPIARREPIVRDDVLTPAEPAPAVQAEAAPKAEVPVAEQPAAQPTALPTPAPPVPVDTLPAAAPATPPPAAAPQDELAPPAPAHGSEPAAVPAAHSPHAEHGVEPEAEHGAGHGEHTGFSVKTFVLQLINFGVLLFLLIRFGGRAMNKALRARHDQLKGDIGDAARLRDEAKQKFDSQEKRVAELEKEISALRESMRRDAAQEQARMEKTAHERAKRMQEEMRIQLEEQVKVAESLLRAEVASASVKLAEELIRKAVNSDDERRLAREFVAGFDVPDGPGGVVR